MPLAQPVQAGLPDCEALAAAAGQAEGLPEGLLPAIARVESGHAAAGGGRRAWPWTLNQGGDGGYFDTSGQALDRLAAILATGETNVDVGCMQLNWRWHSAAFPSARDMIDPAQNTAYAARFLRELNDRLGSWEAAAGAYHSMDPARAQAYGQKVAAVLEGQDVSPMAEEVQIAEEPSGAVQGILAVAALPLVDLAGDEPLRAEALVTRAEPMRLPEWALRAAAPDTSIALRTAETAPGRLKGHWDEVTLLREVLAAQP